MGITNGNNNNKRARISKNNYKSYNSRAVTVLTIRLFTVVRNVIFRIEIGGQSGDPEATSDIVKQKTKLYAFHFIPRARA